MALYKQARRCAGRSIARLWGMAEPQLPPLRSHWQGSGCLLTGLRRGVVARPAAVVALLRWLPSARVEDLPWQATWPPHHPLWLLPCNLALQPPSIWNALQSWPFTLSVEVTDVLHSLWKRTYKDLDEAAWQLGWQEPFLPPGQCLPLPIPTPPWC